MTAQTRTPVIILLATAAILSIPLIAMQVTSEVNWNWFDFLIAGTLLSGTGIAIDFFLRKVRKTSHRIMVVGGILVLLAAVWAELAVGIFGTPLAGS